MSKEFSFPIRVYFEDTDAGGVVYHANYLKFAERGRTEALYTLGFNHRELKEKQDMLFIVRSCFLNCLAPAYLDDVLEVKTYFKDLGRVKIGVRQSIVRGDTLIATLEVVLACINAKGRPVRIDEKMRLLFTTQGYDLEK